MADYIPVFLDWLEETQELNSQEKGRLIDALVTYARGGDWQEQIKGNERYVFPVFRGKIDRHFEYLQMQREKGKARASKNQPKPAEASQEQPTQAKYNNNNKNNENNKYNEKNIGVTVRASRFTAPTIDEVKAYCTEQGYRVDAERFVAYYESNGWKVGKNPMKDWRAAVRTWVRNDQTGQKTAQKPVAMQFEQRDYTGVDFSALNADLSKYK